MIRHQMHPVLLAWSFERLSEIVTWNTKAEYTQDECVCVCGGGWYYTFFLFFFFFLTILSKWKFLWEHAVPVFSSPHFLAARQSSIPRMVTRIRAVSRAKIQENNDNIRREGGQWDALCISCRLNLSAMSSPKKVKNLWKPSQTLFIWKLET